MRYPQGQKEKTRQRLLHLSSELSKQHGFSAMSVDDLMSAAGMTGGAFYAHFDSKDALFIEMMTHELARSADMLSPQAGESRGEWLAKTLDTYLSVAHVQHPESGCVIPALGAEIGRADIKIKRTYEAAMTRFKERWAERLGDPDLAWVVVCQMVGTIVVARAMASKATADEIVKANRVHLERVAGKSRRVSGRIAKAQA